MRELALASGFSVAAVSRELELMERAGLARRERVGNAHLFQANHDSEHSELLLELLTAAANESSVKAAPYEDDVVRTMLAEYGAPLVSREVGAGQRPSTLEELLAYALGLSHRDPYVALVIPLVLDQTWRTLDLAALRYWATRVGEKQALGFFLELTGELARKEEYRREAGRLRDRRFKKQRSYFTPEEVGRFSRELADLRTPDSARRWKYRMNLPTDSFAAHFKKFSSDRANIHAH